MTKGPRTTKAGSDLMGTGIYQSPWRILRHRDYRLLWMGNAFSQLGDHMQLVAQSWLIWQITGSITALGLAAFVGIIPRFTIGTLGGPMVDNNDRRKMLVLTQSLALFFSLLFALLVKTGLVNLWLALGLIFSLEATQIINQMCRQALLQEIVPRQDIAGAVSLNSTGANLARIAGPAAGGVLIPLMGVAGLMLINSLTFLGILLALGLLKIPARKQVESKTSFTAELRTGYLLVWQDNKLKMLLYLALVSALLVMPFTGLLPAYVDNVLAKGPEFFGFLISLFGVGGIIGALSTATVHGHLGNRALLLAALGQGTLLIIFATSNQPWLSLLMMLFLGMATMLYNTGIITEIQLSTPREFLGRVMGLYLLNKGVTSLGALLQGLLAKWLGIGGAFAFCGAVYLLMGAGIQGWKQLRVIKSNDC